MRLPVILSLTLLLLALGIVPSRAEAPFVIGIAPHTSARVILDMYEPLRSYLEKELGRPVEVATAPDFDTFARRGMSQEFDLAVTTGHQARLLQTDAGYLPLLTYKADFKAVVLVDNGSSLKSPGDLKGKQVLGLSPASLVTIWGLHWLKDNGVDTSTVKYVSASDSVAQLILAGDASAGFTSLANYQKLPPEIKNRLRIFAESKPMAGRVYVLNQRHKSLKKKIDRFLLAFAATPEARNYFTTNKLEGYRQLRPTELKEMDRYAAETRKVISTPKK